MKAVMDKLELAFAAVGGVVGWFLGGFDGFLYALIVFVVMDYLTGGVAADDGHLFKDENLETGATGLEGASHAGKARADDHDVVFFVPLLNLGGGDAGIGGGAGHERGGDGGAGLQEAATSKIDVTHLNPLR